MYKKCKVVMLATNNKSFLFIKSHNDLEYNKLNPIHGINHLGWKYQNFFILSDDEIKEGDWIINSMNNVAHIHCYNADLKCYQYIINGALCDVKSDDKKIIATTDSSLEIERHEPWESSYRIPSIPQSFIDKYVNEYNAGNIITEVLVEYEEEIIGYGKITSVPIKSSKIILKLNPDNTINIKSIKDSWSREEVIELCTAAFYHKDVSNGLPYDYCDSSLGRWVKANL